MAIYAPESVGVPAPNGGFQQGGWYGGRQYWGGTLSEPGVIHPSSNQSGAGSLVSPEVNAQSAAAQGQTAAQLEAYLESQRRKSVKAQPSVQTQGNGAMGTSSFDMPSVGATGAGMGLSAPTPAIDLPNLYKSLYSSSGIDAIQADLSEKEKQFIEAKGKINDNPFLSEATRVGRVAKMEQLYNERTASLRNDIATKKADVETQLNLQTKQFDINSQQAKDALNQFNSLLGMGALDNASGEDIANMTRATGLSSSILNSAIDARRKEVAAKSVKDVKTSVHTSTADNGVVTAYTINEATGEIINKVSLGAIGNAQNGPAAKEAKPEEVVGGVIRSYLSDKSKQAQISPEDLYRELLLQYPSAASYIKENWTAENIRGVLRS